MGGEESLVSVFPAVVISHLGFPSTSVNNSVIIKSPVMNSPSLCK